MEITSVSTTSTRLAEAALQVVAREGFDALSVRTVARQAQVAPGTVQHHFPTRAALLLGAFERAVETASARLGDVALTGPVGPTLRAALREFLPLDDRRRLESSVWVALSAAGPSHPELAEAHARAVRLLPDALVTALDDARQRGELAAGVDPDMSGSLLAAVVDGLALQGLSRDAQPHVLEKLLDAAVSALCGEPVSAQKRGRHA